MLEGGETSYHRLYVGIGGVVDYTIKHTFLDSTVVVYYYDTNGDLQTIDITDIGSTGTTISDDMVYEDDPYIYVVISAATDNIPSEKLQFSI